MNFNNTFYRKLMIKKGILIERKPDLSYQKLHLPIDEVKPKPIIVELGNRWELVYEFLTEEPKRKINLYV